MCDEKKDLVIIKYYFSSQRGQTATGQTANAGFPTFPTSKRLISGCLPAFGFVENQTDLNSSLLPHLTCFITRFFASHPRFRFTES